MSVMTKERREAEIAEIAHRIWLEEGKPDGEVLVEFFGRKVPLKEVHWHWATIEWTYGSNYFRSW